MRSTTPDGGEGNDRYGVDDPLDLVTELPGAGTDTVWTTLSSYALGANLEHLIYGGGGAFTGTGNALNNTLRGGSGADTLEGGAGNDLLFGGAGNDIFVFAAPGFGRDWISDFDADALGGQDLLDVSGLGITAATFEAAVTLTDLGNDTLITIGDDSIRLVRVGDPATVDANDFLFA